MPQTMFRVKNPFTGRSRVQPRRFTSRKTKENRNAHWTYPLSVRRVQSHWNWPSGWFWTGTRCLLTTNRIFDGNCGVHVADAAYSTKDWIANGEPIPNLIHISRLRSNRILYRQPLSSRRKKKTKGGLQATENHFDWALRPHLTRKLDLRRFPPQGKGGLSICRGWRNVLTRGDKTQRMEKYPFDVVRAEVFDEAGQRVFKNPLWLMVTGQRRSEVKSEQVYGSYSQRYDIEHCFVLKSRSFYWLDHRHLTHVTKKIWHGSQCSVLLCFTRQDAWLSRWDIPGKTVG